MLIELYTNWPGKKESLGVSIREAKERSIAGLEGAEDFVYKDVETLDWCEGKRKRHLERCARQFYEEMAWRLLYGGKVPEDWLCPAKIEEDVCSFGSLYPELIDAITHYPTRKISFRQEKGSTGRAIEALGLFQVLNVKQLATILARSDELGINKNTIIGAQLYKGLAPLKIVEAEIIGKQERNKLCNFLYEQEFSFGAYERYELLSSEPAKDITMIFNQDEFRVLWQTRHMTEAES